mgnify:CR=1 FL=1
MGTLARKAGTCLKCATRTGFPLTFGLNLGTRSYPESVELSQLAERHGFRRVMFADRPPDPSLEGWTLSTGVAVHTEKVIIAHNTLNIPFRNVAITAKMAATIDHVSNGRFALNLVAGWFQDEFDMFGVNLAPHAERYDYAAEWLTLVKRLWREEDAFDFAGKYFQGQGLWSQPKPLQSPRPPIMNAGSSETGHAFSARHADMNFAMLRQKDADSDRHQIAHLKQLAADQGRSSQCWIHVYVVCRETEREARDYLHRYVVEQGDDEAVGNMIRIFGAQSATLSDDVLVMRSSEMPPAPQGEGTIPASGDLTCAARHGPEVMLAEAKSHSPVTL